MSCLVDNSNRKGCFNGGAALMAFELSLSLPLHSGNSGGMRASIHPHHWPGQGSFWLAHGAHQILRVVHWDMQAVEDVNRQTGANVDPNADAGDMLQSNTRGLMAAMSTLPELTERKRTIDKHTALLGCIMKVGLPAFPPGLIHSAGDRLQSNTRGLMAAVSTLPMLTQRKRTIDKLTALLGFIMKVGPQPSPPRRRCALH